MNVDNVLDKSKSSSKPGPKRKRELKLGLFHNDLADKFGISMAQFSKIYTNWIKFSTMNSNYSFLFLQRAKIDEVMLS